MKELKILLMVGVLFITILVIALCKTSGMCSKLEENEMDYDIL